MCVCVGGGESGSGGRRRGQTGRWVAAAMCGWEGAVDVWDVRAGSCPRGGWSGGEGIGGGRIWIGERGGARGVWIRERETVVLDLGFLGKEGVEGVRERR